MVLSLQYVTAFAKLATTTQYRLAAEASYMRCKFHLVLFDKPVLILLKAFVDMQITDKLIRLNLHKSID